MYRIIYKLDMSKYDRFKIMTRFYYKIKFISLAIYSTNIII